MPQAVPLEASDTLAFTPESLKVLPNPPAFTLRAPTTREKRAVERLKIEERFAYHPVDAIRKELLAGLLDLYGEGQDYTEAAEFLTGQWELQDEFVMARKVDPDAVFAASDETVEREAELRSDVFAHWKPLRTMGAQNVDYESSVALLHAAVTIQRFKNLNAKRVVEDGYLTVDCAYDIRQALFDAEVAADKEFGLIPGTAWLELAGEVLRRFYLGEEQEKNSASPSPSKAAPAASTETASEPDGSSPASESSTETPESA